MTKISRQETIVTTYKPMPMLSITNYKEENKRPDRGRKHHGFVNIHGTI